MKPLDHLPELGTECPESLGEAVEAFKRGYKPIVLDVGTEVTMSIPDTIPTPIEFDETMCFANGMRMEKAEAEFIRANPCLMAQMRHS